MIMSSSVVLSNSTNGNQVLHRIQPDVDTVVRRR